LVQTTHPPHVSLGY